MMAASFAEIWARMSAQMLHAALANAKQQQHAVPGSGHGPAAPAPSPLVPPSPFFPLPLVPVPPVSSPLPPPALLVPFPSPAKETVADNGSQQKQRKDKDSDGMEAQQNRKDPILTSDNRRGAKRKKPAEEPQQQQQQLDVPVADRRPCSSSPLSSRISSPDSAGTPQKARKLKLYAAEEKVDIIDYAKCIGNRAAGREFNVAESSIREWRKNEEKIRRQAETTPGCTQHYEREHSEVVGAIDDKLVEMVAEKGAKECGDWYAIAAKARELWAHRAENSADLDGSEMKITMGWVSRFMRRNEQRVPKIAPPIIATGSTPTATNGGGGGTPLGPAGAVSMVKSRNHPMLAETRTQRETRSRTGAKRAEAGGKGGKNEGKDEAERKKKDEGGRGGRGDEGTSRKMEEQVPSPPATSSTRRRKCLRPMRVDATCATVLTSSVLLSPQ